MRKLTCRVAHACADLCGALRCYRLVTEEVDPERRSIKLANHSDRTLDCRIAWRCSKNLAHTKGTARTQRRFPAPRPSLTRFEQRRIIQCTRNRQITSSAVNRDAVHPFQARLSVTMELVTVLVNHNDVSNLIRERELNRTSKEMMNIRERAMRWALAVERRRERTWELGSVAAQEDERSLGVRLESSDRTP